MNIKINSQHARERRRGDPPIPSELGRFLTAQQLGKLPELEKMGIRLVAVRRPLFQEPVVIVKCVNQDRHGVLLKDGTVDYLPDIELREGRASTLADGSLLPLK